MRIVKSFIYIKQTVYAYLSNSKKLECEEEKTHVLPTLCGFITEQAMHNKHFHISRVIYLVICILQNKLKTSRSVEATYMSC